MFGVNVSGQVQEPPAAADPHRSGRLTHTHWGCTEFLFFFLPSFQAAILGRQLSESFELISHSSLERIFGGRSRPRKRRRPFFRLTHTRIINTHTHTHTHTHAHQWLEAKVARSLLGGSSRATSCSLSLWFFFSVCCFLYFLFGGWVSLFPSVRLLRLSGRPFTFFGRQVDCASCCGCCCCCCC